jgi:hypothetical protein
LPNPLRHKIAESFHNRLMTLIGEKNLSFYRVLEEIKSELKNSMIEFIQIENRTLDAKESPEMAQKRTNISNVLKDMPIRTPVECVDNLVAHLWGI